MSILDFLKNENNQTILKTTGKNILPGQYDPYLEILFPSRTTSTQVDAAEVTPNGPKESWYKMVPTPVWIGGGLVTALLISMAVKKKRRK